MRSSDPPLWKDGGYFLIHRLADVDSVNGSSPADGPLRGSIPCHRSLCSLWLLRSPVSTCSATTALCFMRRKETRCVQGESFQALKKKKKTLFILFLLSIETHYKQCNSSLTTSEVMIERSRHDKKTKLNNVHQGLDSRIELVIEK